MTQRFCPKPTEVLALAWLVAADGVPVLASPEIFSVTLVKIFPEEIFNSG